LSLSIPFGTEYISIGSIFLEGDIETGILYGTGIIKLVDTVSI